MKATLKITRIGGFLSRIRPYEIWFNGQKIGLTRNDKDSIFIIDRANGVLKLKEPGMAFHPIQKEVVIFQERLSESNIIECNVLSKINWLGICSLWILAPIMNMSVEVKYK